MWLETRVKKRRRNVPFAFIATVYVCLFGFFYSRAQAATPVNKSADGKNKTAVETSAQEAPPNGLRYWAPFQKTPIQYDYVAGACRDGQIVYFLCCEDFKRPAEETIMISFPPGGERDRNKIRVLFSSKLIDDVGDPADPQKPAACVQMARTAMYHDPQVGYVCMNSLFPGRMSDYGKRSLVPAIFSSLTGEPGTWKYHGKLKGEPADYENELRGKNKRWIGEGCVVRVGENSWRAYLGGYGVSLAAAASESLDGPWQFIRDRNGKLKDLLGATWKGGGCFPYVLKVSEKEFHLWLAENWPVGPVWHFSSADGLDFKPYGRQPEIHLAAVQAKSMKGIRAFLDADGKTIRGLIPFGFGSGWLLYQSTLPVGLQPATP
jgi:hypothetical protein